MIETQAMEKRLTSAEMEGRRLFSVRAAENAGLL